MESNMEYLQTTRASPPSQELSRLIAAAVVNKTFCHILLTNPAEALQKGFSTETFELNAAERSLVMAIHATDIVDFAQQIADGKASRVARSISISNRPVSEGIKQANNRVEHPRPRRVIVPTRRHINQRGLKKRSAA